MLLEVVHCQTALLNHISDFVRTMEKTINPLTILNYLDSFWTDETTDEPTPQFQLLSWGGIPTPARVDIATYPPTPSRPCYTLCTIGLSACAMPRPPSMESTTAKRIELMMYMPPDWTPSPEGLSPEDVDEKGGAKGDRDPGKWPYMALMLTAAWIASSNAFVWPSNTIPLFLDGTPPSPDSLLTHWLFVPPIIEAPGFGTTTIDGNLQYMVSLPNLFLNPDPNDPNHPNDDNTDDNTGDNTVDNTDNNTDDNTDDNTDSDNEISFLVAVTLTTAEYRAKRQNGYAALVPHLESTAIPALTDVSRPSAIAPNPDNQPSCAQQ